jgi:hypothetical protein
MESEIVHHRPHRSHTVVNGPTRERLLKYIRGTISSLAALCVWNIWNCGRVLSPEDAGLDASDAASDGGDGGGRCTGAFGSAIAVSELNSSLDDRGLRLSVDELSAVFSRGNTDDSGLPNKDTNIYFTTRVSLSSSFSAPIDLSVVTEVNFAGVYPSLAADSLALFLESYCLSNTLGTPTPSGYCLSTRDAAADTFPGSSAMLFVQGATSLGRFGIGAAVGDGFTTSDGLSYYFIGPTGLDAGNDSAVHDAGLETGVASDSVFVSAETTIGSGFYLANSVFVPTDPTVLVDNPVVSSDELTMFVSITSTTTPVPHIQSATRATTSDAFGTLLPFHELDSAEGEYPTWISPDQCRLYLTRSVGGQADMYMATRSTQ